jgi:hypothetical protein
MAADEQELETLFQSEILAAMAANERVVIDLDVYQAWTLLGQLQLALRHPGNEGASADVARSIIAVIAGRLCKPGSAMETVYVMGEQGL